MRLFGGLLALAMVSASAAYWGHFCVFSHFCAHGFLGHGDAHSRLEEAANAAAESNVQHALRDEEALNVGSHVHSSSSGFVERNLNRSTKLSISTVTVDASDDHGCQVKALGQAEAAAAKEGKAPVEG